jgi:predicted dehydrogenase
MQHTTVTRRSFMGAAALASAPLAAQDASSRTVRMGIVGGNFGSTFQWHLDPGCKVTAVCDIQPRPLARLAEVYHCDVTYRDFRDLLKSRDVDAVGVFTPAPLHVWMATQAMKAGKHVISAVPAGMSLDELQELLACVKSTGMKYMMAETSFYRPQIIACREWARDGRFGTIFYSEAEYHHEGLIGLMFDDRGLPTWRHGFPPMHYPTHSTGMVVPVTGERLVEVEAVGWGDGHEVLKTNQYKNPFWSATAFFKTSGGHASRISVFWHVAAGGTERSQFFGDRMSYIMERPEGSLDTVVRISKQGRTVMDGNGYPEGEVAIETDHPDYVQKLPPSLRVKSAHGNSHPFLTHEFVSAILEDRQPAVNVWEAIAYTAPGIVAHQSALRGGEPMKIRDYGRAPA